MMVTETTPAKPAVVKCPGWHHEFDKDGCDIDRKVFGWVTQRQQTTLAEREIRRAEAHARAGIFQPHEEE